MNRLHPVPHDSSLFSVAGTVEGYGIDSEEEWP